MRQADVAERLRTHPLLAGLDAATVKGVHAAGIVQTFAAGDCLIREGDPAVHYWLLLSGTLKVGYTSPDGFEVTVKVFAAPAAFAEMEVLTDQPHIENCFAIDKATMLKIPRVPFEALLDDHPRFMKNVLYDTCARFFIAAQNERALAFLPVSQRLANLLLVYMRIYGVSVEGGTAIRVRLSQADLAADLGVAKKSITRTLAGWGDDGILERRGTTLVIKDPAALEERSAHDVIGVDWIAGRRVDEGKGSRRRV